MADTQKPSWLSVLNAVGTLAVLLLGVWFSDGETPVNPPSPTPIVNPLPPAPSPGPIVESPSVNYVVGPDGTVLDDGSVGHFSAVSKQSQGSYEFHRIQSKKPVSITRIVVGDGLPTPHPPKPIDPPKPPEPQPQSFADEVAVKADGIPQIELNAIANNYETAANCLLNGTLKNQAVCFAWLRESNEKTLHPSPQWKPFSAWLLKRMETEITDETKTAATLASIAKGLRGAK